MFIKAFIISPGNQGEHKQIFGLRNHHLVWYVITSKRDIPPQGLLRTPDHLLVSSNATRRNAGSPGVHVINFARVFFLRLSCANYVDPVQFRKVCRFGRNQSVLKTHEPISSWWLNHPILVKMGSSSPNRGKHKKYFQTTT